MNLSKYYDLLNLINGCLSLLFSSVAVMTRAFPDVNGQRRDLIMLQEVASYLLMACGLSYVISVK